MNNIGVLYYEKGVWDEALRWYFNSLRVREVLNDPKPLGDSYTGIANVYADQNDLKLAISYHKLALSEYKLYYLYKDSLFNEEKGKEIGRLEATYEFEKAEQQRMQSELAALRLQDEHKARRVNLQYSGILIFLAMH